MCLNKKSAIITWHNYPNFGSALQAYALCHFINENGGEAKIINYVPKYLPKLRNLRYLFSMFDRILPSCISRKLNYRFIKFENEYLRETKMVRNEAELKEMNKYFDNFVCGSDQIWAPNCFNENYFLSFVSDGKNKVSYAASIGLPDIPENLRTIYKTLLDRLNHISVREEQGARLLKKLFNIDAAVCLDPTFLIEGNEWKRLGGGIGGTKKKYILCYFLGKTQWHRDYAIEMANRIGVGIICLSQFEQDIENSDFRTITDVGPLEFISYIKNAEYILTDSFHGVSFSINLEKPFLCFERFKANDVLNQNSRIYNILSILDLSDRLIKDFTYYPKTDIDYYKVKEKLTSLRFASVNYLKKSEIIP